MAHLVKTIVSNASTLEMLDVSVLRYSQYVDAMDVLEKTVALVSQCGGEVVDQSFESVVYLYNNCLFQVWVEGV